MRTYCNYLSSAFCVDLREFFLVSSMAIFRFCRRRLICCLYVTLPWFKHPGRCGFTTWKFTLCLKQQPLNSLKNRDVLQCFLREIQPDSVLRVTELMPFVYAKADSIWYIVRSSNFTIKFHSVIFDRAFWYICRNALFYLKASM